MALKDRREPIDEKSPSTLLPSEDEVPYYLRKEAPLKQAPSSLLPEEGPARRNDPASENTVAVSPSSLLPPDRPRSNRAEENTVAVSPSSLLPREPKQRDQTRHEQFPRQGPSSLLPEAPADLHRDLAREHAVAVSPSSLLPEPPPLLSEARTGQFPSQSPSSLLPEASADVHHDPASENTVAVSPSDLLPPQPPSIFSKWINKWTLGGGGAIVITSLLAIFLAHYQSTPHLMQEAVKDANAGNHDAAIIRFNDVLKRQPDHGEARYLLARSQLAQGNAEIAETELRRSLAAGGDKGAIRMELARAMLRQGKYQALLDDFVPAAADTDAGLINALRGLALFALGKEAEARAAFELSLRQTPENPNALLGLARLAERSKRLDEADALINRALRANGGSADGWLLKGELRWR